MIEGSSEKGRGTGDQKDSAEGGHRYWEEVGIKATGGQEVRVKGGNTGKEDRKEGRKRWWREGDLQEERAVG